MEVREINDKNLWEEFLSDCKEKTFLQSFNWGEFQKMMGNKIWRWGIYHREQRTKNPEGKPPASYGAGNEQLIAVACIIKIGAKRGTFLFVPHGPVMKYEVGSMKYEVLKVLLEELRRIAKEENASFIRIAPILERNEENINIFKKLGFKKAPIHMHPELTRELDITFPEEELLMKMRKTTRYLIRQAQKNKDIEIIKSDKIEDVGAFNKLYQETVDRHHFIPFSLDYLENEFLAFRPDDEIFIFLGKYKGEIISSAIIIFWQDIVFYHHGASSQKYSKVPVSYLLQWEAIKEAKSRGCKTYNFWGIAPVFATAKTGISNFQPSTRAKLGAGLVPHRNKVSGAGFPISKQIQNSKSQISNRKHPWYGLTLFKMGFGGYSKKYVKTQDFPISKKYWLNFIVEKLRKTKRGL